MKNRHGKDFPLSDFLGPVREYLSIPSVSTQPEYKEAIKKAVNWLVSYFQKIGIKAEVWPTTGHPYVFASTNIDPAKPTILVYGHYDVQPPDPMEEWQSPPFQPVVRGGAIYGRGATDNKLQHLVYLLAAAYVLKRPIFAKKAANLKFIIEGEEEIGSTSAAKVLPKYKRKLQADFLLVSDGPMIARGRPTIVAGTRGLLCAQLEITTGLKDLHSGLYGGAVDNPAIVLSWIISKIKDRQGKIKIPGFYRRVLPVDPEEKNSFARFPLKEKDFLSETGVYALFPEKGYSVFESTRIRPSMDINGMLAGYTGAGTKTIIPKRASVKLSFRLVPRQNPKEVFFLLEAYLKKIMPATVHWRLESDGLLEPYVWEGPMLWQKKAKKILEEIWGAPAVVSREGGSIGILDFFKRRLKIESLLVNLGSPDDNLHAPNEKFDLENLEKGFQFAVRFFSGD